MTRILVLSDTHVPRIAPDLPAQIYDDIRAADMVMHAGDFVEKELLDTLKGLKRTVAVYGNMDSPDLHRALNSKEVVEVEDVRIGLVHGHGAPRDLITTVRSDFPEVDAIVFGHSHSVVNTVIDGVLFFNPGSPTDKIFATSNSYGILEISGKKIEGRIIRI